MLTAKIIVFWAVFALLFGGLFLLGRLADRTIEKPDDEAGDGAAPAAEPAKKKEEPRHGAGAGKRGRKK